MRYPPVGPSSRAMPGGSTGDAAKTGRPAIPSARYSSLARHAEARAERQAADEHDHRLERERHRRERERNADLRGDGREHRDERDRARALGDLPRA